MREQTPSPADDDIRSPGGSPILRHREAAAWSPAAGKESTEAISSHVTRHLGEVATVLHEIVSDTVHVDVLVVQPSAQWPFIRLVTSGMSDLPMTTPKEADVPSHVELVMTLPFDWRLAQNDFQDECWYWPVRLIKTLARLPHKYGTWLGLGHTVPNGDPPAPYAPATQLSGAMVLPPLSIPEGFRTLDLADGRCVTFYAVVPLHASEMDLKLKRGTDALLDLLSRKNVDDVIDPERKPVTAKRFGFWPLG